MELIHKIKDQKYRTRVFCYMAMIALISVIFLGYYLFSSYMKEVKKTVLTTTQSDCSQICDQMDEIFTNLHKDYMEKMNSDEMRWALSHKLEYREYSHLKEVMDVLDGSTYLSEYIRGFTFLNMKHQWVLSNRGLYPFSNVINQKEVQSLYEKQKNPLVKCFWYENEMAGTQGEITREQVNLYGLLFVMRLPLIKKDADGMAIININTDKIISMVLQNLIDTEVTVLNESGQIEYSSSTAFQDFCEQNHQKLMEKKKEGIYKINDKSYSVASCTSSQIGWTVVTGYHFNAFLVDSGRLFRCIIMLCLVEIILLLIARGLSYIIYRPVSLLTNQIKEFNKTIPALDDHPEEKDELVYIKQGIDHLIDSNQCLEHTLEHQEGQLMEFFQLRLIRGEVNSERLKDYMEQVHLCVSKYLMTLACNICTPDGVEEYDEAKQDAIRINVVENLPEEIRQMLALAPSCNAKVIFMAASDEDQDQLEQKVMQIYGKLARYVLTTYGLHIHVGVSTAYSSLLEFRSAYNMSVEALKNHELLYHKDENLESGIMFYSDITADNNQYTYNLLLEKELKEAVDSCNQEEAFRAIDRCLDDLKNHKISNNELYFYLQRYVMATILVATNAGLQIEEVFQTNVSSIFLSFNQLYDLEKLRTFLRYRIIAPVIEHLNQFRGSRTSEIMEKIRNLVENANGNITMNECAQQLSYHPSYIWKVVKKEKDTTFTEYVADYKIERAKQFLENGKLSVAEIASVLGYTNTQNFIRFFSKHVGITPGRYRSQN